MQETIRELFEKHGLSGNSYNGLVDDLVMLMNGNNPIEDKPVEDVFGRLGIALQPPRSLDEVLNIYR